MPEDAITKEGTTQSPFPLRTPPPGLGWGPVRGPQELLARFVQYPELEQAVRKDPRVLGAILQPLQSDKWIYRIVVTALGLAVLGSIAGTVVLALHAVNIPEGIVAIGSAAVGALAGLLAPSPARGGE